MSNPFANWSAADVERYHALKKRERSGEWLNPSTAPREREADLHDEIEKELKRRGWYYVHSRLDRPTTTAKGVTDFIIAAHWTLEAGARTFWIEAKGATTKVTTEQLGTIQWLRSLGHRAEIVRSLEEFLKIIS